MSARVLNPPMLMTMEMSRGLPTGGRVIPTKAQLAPVRRDLFGPVDHAAAKALAERELKAQSRLDTERWGFDFQSGIPQRGSRYAWEIVNATDVVPEPYALRGMPYLRKHAPSTPRKSTNSTSKTNPKSPASTRTPESPLANNSSSTSSNQESESRIYDLAISPGKAEMTPPQESRVPDVRNRNGNETTPEDNPREREINVNGNIGKNRSIEEPTTPVLPHAARKQSIITGEIRCLNCLLLYLFFFFSLHS